MQKERIFIELDKYPQASIMPEGEWSEPLLGGVGCNFFLGRKGNLPPFSDKEKWEKIANYLYDLQIGMMRVGFLPTVSGDAAQKHEINSPWDDTTQRFDFDHDYFKIVKFLDDLADTIGFPLMIDPWWVPESMWVKNIALEGRGAPENFSEYAEKFILPFVNQIINVLECRHITYLGLLNEPVWKENDRDMTNYAVPEGEDQLICLTRMYEAVRTCLDKNGFHHLKIVGPSALCSYQFPMADFLASRTDPTPYLDVFDHHYYFYHLDNVKSPGKDFFSMHETVDGNVRRWCDFARRQKKPFLITEMGSFAYGRLFWGERDMQGPASHICAVSDAEFIIRSLAYGAQGFMRWAFSVPEHYDGRWSLIEWNEHAIWTTPHIYPMYRQLMRVIRPGSRIMRIRSGCSAGYRSSVSAIAVKNADKISLLIVNSEPGLNADVIIGPGPWSGKTLNRIVVDELRKGEQLNPISFGTDPKLGSEVMLTPYSLTLLENSPNHQTYPGE